MGIAAEDIVRGALELPDREKLDLAARLLESAGPADSGAEAAWDAEIRERLLAVREGRVEGVAYEDVLRDVERLYRS